MTERLSPEEYAQLDPAETHAFPSPVPTQVISNGEFVPAPQGELQSKFETRLKERADLLAKRHGLSRRAFLRTASGMAAAFLAMNDIYGRVFRVSEAEAADAELGDEHAGQLSNQFVFDVHTHFLKDDTRLQYFVDLRTDTGKRGFNPKLARRKQDLNDVKFPTYIKEVFLDSDTKVAVLSGAPSDIPQDWMLSNDSIREACDRVNRFAGSRRMLPHFIFVPGQPGWLEAIDHGIAVLKPAGWKGYTIGDNTHKETSRYPWRMDDEKMAYRGYEKFDKAGLRVVAVHKGLFPPSDERRFRHLAEYARVDDVGKAAKDWPQLNFLIYHAGYRYTGDDNPALATAQFDETGRMDWVSDLAEVPAKFGVANVYADIGASFAALCLSHPRGAAAMLGILVKGLGYDHVLWGTDSLWFGSPQWQIEAFRRMEIPEDMQRQHGFTRLGAADGPVKRAILGGNGARVYGLQRHADAEWLHDGLAEARAAYLADGRRPSNLAYGYIRKPLA
jgi:uncharacterized protein